MGRAYADHVAASGATMIYLTGMNTTYSGSNSAAEVARTDENSDSEGTCAHESCSLAANAWEWTNDGYDHGAGGSAKGSADVDPAGPLSDSGDTKARTV
ncbi:hypothetical protein LBMAG42_51580 [Deltaproteobacteria bacterium]|nr:hypothetical protein LBMAG42_51580 [Deltaproteobacteria bacterium]